MTTTKKIDALMRASSILCELVEYTETTMLAIQRPEPREVAKDTGAFHLVLLRPPPEAEVCSPCGWPVVTSTPAVFALEAGVDYLGENMIATISGRIQSLEGALAELREAFTANSPRSKVPENSAENDSPPANLDEVLARGSWDIEDYPSSVMRMICVVLAEQVGHLAQLQPFRDCRSTVVRYLHGIGSADDVFNALGETGSVPENTCTRGERFAQAVARQAASLVGIRSELPLPVPVLYAAEALAYKTLRPSTESYPELTRVVELAPYVARLLGPNSAMQVLLPTLADVYNADAVLSRLDAAIAHARARRA